MPTDDLSAEAEPGAEIPPFCRALAMQLVTRNRMRLADARDSRLGALGGAYDFCVAAWTGPRAALVAFYSPPPGEAAGDDLRRRMETAAAWGSERLSVQGAAEADILLIALGPVPEIDFATSNSQVKVGAAWVDLERGSAEAVVPVAAGLPGPRELRKLAQALLQGAPAPTLAAVDLAERETVHGGTAAKARRALLATPYVTYGLIASFVVVYVIEYALNNRYGFAGLLGAGLIDTECHPCAFSGSPLLYGDDWWRYISTAFLHEPSGVLSWHLVMNSFAMYQLGRVIEPLYGRLMTGFTFLFAAIAGNVVTGLVAAANLPGSSPSTLGASGGIVGLLGLLLVLGVREGKHVPAGLRQSLRQSVGISVLMLAFIGFAIPGVNNWAHGGGFVAGALAGLVLPPVPAIGGRDHRIYEQVFMWAVIAAGVVAAGFWAANLVTFVASPPIPSLFPGQ